MVDPYKLTFTERVCVSMAQYPKMWAWIMLFSSTGALALIGAGVALVLAL